MTRRALFARRFELRVWMVCKDVCRLLALLSVLAIRYCVHRKAFHKIHLAECATRVLNKPVLRFQFPYQIDNVCVDAVAELRVLRYRIQISRCGISRAMKSSFYSHRSAFLFRFFRSCRACDILIVSFDCAFHSAIQLTFSPFKGVFVGDNVNPFI